ncbi:Uricase [Wickerhamomyces ciferrii]|uniref:Uricase n=1 Tax=Wickerhamomyces ciferrii (strain ATCC 14091 / BCRC 22168 / CBS 111 / JCM 3599 / NBRC 0793 / NRRL Y-1031 F-60-10) TaxID=1206466 RepID=K0KJJ7_WICCF|nr:Uricase [Wickerhamomyces ciferrii]CCH43151.1 Uricase [Wickerhamomyces ciferrii]
MALQSSSYGKDNVKFLKVKKDPQNPQKHQIIEATVKVLLEGSFDTSYTHADNSSIVPTDTVKNTILVLAKTTEVFPIENFVATIGQHFIKKYNHVDSVSVNVIQDRWVKYEVDGKLHDHSFIHQGPEKRITDLYLSRSGDYTLKSSIKDLTVLKSTGSQFHGYNVCDFTTLKPAFDRILSTDVDSTWKFDSKKLGPISNISKLSSQGLFDKIYEYLARKITLDTFALENSPSVQGTMYNMATDILSKANEVESVDYSLPNKHYFLMDFEWKGLKNDQEVFYPSPHPNGLIKCSVVRDSKSKL